MYLDTLNRGCYPRDRYDFFYNRSNNLQVYNAIHKHFLLPLLSQRFSWYFHSRTATLSRSNTPLDSGDHITQVSLPVPDVPSKSAFWDDTASLRPWAEAFSGQRRAMRFLVTPSDQVSQYFDWVGVPSDCFVSLLDYPLALVLPLFKAIQVWCHKNFDVYGAAVRYFISLDSLSGIPPADLRLSSDDPNLWLTALVGSDYSREWWSQQFGATFSLAVQSLPPELLSLEQFTLNRWMWVTEGATRFSRLMLGDEKVKTKFGAAVSLSDQELLDMVHSVANPPDDQQISVFVKPDEAGYKRRLIANVPLGGYIVCSYIRYLLEEYLGKQPVFVKLNTYPSDYVDIALLLKSGQTAFPLDESAYDYHVTRESWLGFFDFLDSFWPGNVGVSLFKSYFDHAFWLFEGKRGRWLKGMPSGLALTTFLNSWMNYIKQSHIVPSEFHWACGDDVLTFSSNPSLTLEDIEVAYSKFGSQANASKNWYSHHFAEYLKVLYGKYGASGYPTRIYGSLLYTQDARFRSPVSKLAELTDLWKQFWDRMGLRMPEKIVARDLAAALSHKVRGFSTSVALKWLHSPRIHGGFGKLPYNNYTFTWTLTEPVVRSYTMNKIRLPRVVEYYGPVSLTIGKYKLHSSSFSLGKPPPLPPIKTMSDWERRLNREDLPDRGPFTSMVLDLCPLPVVDFVSVAFMSKMASQLSAFVAPNLRGNWSSISSRLINLSLYINSCTRNFLVQHQFSCAL